MKFTIQKEDNLSNARLGEFETAHGKVETPIFMPVGTLGTVKAMHLRDVLNIGAEIILALKSSLNFYGQPFFHRHYCN